MRKAIFAIFLLLLISRGAICAEEKALTYQVVGSNQQWQGTVVVSQPVLVAAGVELQILPGTEIIIKDKRAIIRVEGNLQGLGTQQEPIRFVAPSGWGGIELFQSQGMNRFEQVEISDAEYAVTSYLSQVTIRHSRFQNCRTAIKLHRQSQLNISGTSFNANQVAVDIGTRSQVEIANSRFIANNTAVIASHNSSGSFLDNSFVDNQQGIYLQHLFPGQLSGNRFENNMTAVHCDQTMNSPTITANRFTGNERGVVSLMASQPLLKGNRFERNAVALLNNQLGSPQVRDNFFLENQVAIKNERRSAPQIEQNHFVENRLALLCDYLSYPTVKQNNFLANEMAVKLGDHQSAEMEKQGASKEQMEKFLAESGRQGKLATFTPASGIVDVSLNWWGEDVTHAAEKIFYARRQEKWVLDDSTGERYLRDRISFTPWLQQPVVVAEIK